MFGRVRSVVERKVMEVNGHWHNVHNSVPVQPATFIVRTTHGLLERLLGLSAHGMVSTFTFVAVAGLVVTILLRSSGLQRR
jgi:hypothetical protein